MNYIRRLKAETMRWYREKERRRGRPKLVINERLKIYISYDESESLRKVVDPMSRFKNIQSMDSLSAETHKVEETQLRAAAVTGPRTSNMRSTIYR